MERSPVETNLNVPIEHQNVPEGHRGLHDFLYSADDEHAATSVTATPDKDIFEAEVLPLQDWCDRAANAKVAGVYAVLDAERRTQYVGYSRNVRLSLNGHVAQNGTSACAFVRVQIFKYPKREAMDSLRDTWLSELDYVPPGNGNLGMWASTVGEVATAAMSASERDAYEEKKLKLRKAIADTTLVSESEAMDESEASRRQKLEVAVNNDDWSSVIDSQTQETKS